jgi:hypothetical protein
MGQSAVRLRDRHRRSCAILGICALFWVSGAEADSVFDAMESGRLLLDLRYRTEVVNQANFPNEARANTLRARIGYETGSFKGFTALADFDLIGHVGPEDYNDTVNGRTAYPVIADPDMAQPNRYQLSYTATLTPRAKARAETDLTITGGRQRIIFSNERFVGNVGWRQHEQTFTGISVVNTSFTDTTFTYAFIDRVNRVFGEESPLSHFSGPTHFVNSVYTGIHNVRLETFSYLLDLSTVPGRLQSTASVGFRADSKWDLGRDLTLKVNGGYAYQADYADNPLNISLSYGVAELGLAYRGFSVLGGYEVLDGNGVLGFSTPLATLHAFQGWADVFLITPKEGIQDMYLSVGYATTAVPRTRKVNAVLVYHDFRGEKQSVAFGHEWDGSITADLNDHTSVSFKFALFSGEDQFKNRYPDKDVYWFLVHHRY